MILAAGLGTRLRPLTNVVSKPMVQMAGRPCMEYAVRLLAKHGVKEIVVNLHYMPEYIQNYFGDGSRFGVNIRYSYEKELLGTAGGFKRMQDFFADEPALIVSGDALTDIDLTHFLRFHKQTGGIATLALKRVADPTQYGVVIQEGSRIIRFQEKPKREEAISSLANTGIYLFEPAIFNHIPANTFYDFGKQVFQELLEKNERMNGYVMEEYWCDVGDLNVYKEAHYDMLTGIVQVDLPGKRLDSNIWIGSNVSIHPDTKLVGPILIGNDTVIEEGACIYGPVILGNHTFIGKGAFIKRGILWDDVTIGTGAALTDTVIADGCVIPDHIMLLHEIVEKSMLDTICDSATYNEVAATSEE